MKTEFSEVDIVNNDESAQVNPESEESTRDVSQLPTMAEVIVPRSSVGLIIGKGGESIKRLIKDTGARIQFKHDGESHFLAFYNSYHYSLQRTQIPKSELQLFTEVFRKFKWQQR